MEKSATPSVPNSDQLKELFKSDNIVWVTVKLFDEIKKLITDDPKHA